MARRREIFDAFYDELVDAATGTHIVTYDDGSTEEVTIEEDDVDLLEPEYLERSPAVFYSHQSTVTNRYNGVGSGPDFVERDDGGVVTYAEWQTYPELFLLVVVRGDSPAQKEPIYESIRSRLDAYDDGALNVHDLHEDIKRLRVDTGNPANSTELEDAIWGDQLEVYVEFKRSLIVESGGSMTMDEAVDAVGTVSNVHLDVDVGNDGTVDYDYTIN